MEEKGKRTKMAKRDTNIALPAQELLGGIGGKYSLRLILLFGSQAHGIPHTRSDIDVAVLTECGSGMQMSDQLDLMSDLGEAFEREVDLSILDHADPLFLHRVAESAVLLHGSSRALAELRIKAFRKYQDFRRILKMEREFVLNHYKVGEPDHD
ncbi:MAG: nucleotidyltransferase domain-containing protein [bacterium]